MSPTRSNAGQETSDAGPRDGPARTTAAIERALAMKPDPSPYVGFHKDLRGVHSLWERFNAGLIELEECRSRHEGGS